MARTKSRNTPRSSMHATAMATCCCSRTTRSGAERRSAPGDSCSMRSCTTTSCDHGVKPEDPSAQRGAHICSVLPRAARALSLLPAGGEKVPKADEGALFALAFQNRATSLSAGRITNFGYLEHRNARGPSSGAARHLLPACGEKGKRDAPGGEKVPKADEGRFSP